MNKLHEREVMLFCEMIHTRVLSGSHKAIDLALEMVQDMLIDKSISEGIREHFANDIMIMEEQRNDKQYLMMWETYQRVLKSLYKVGREMQE